MTTQDALNKIAQDKQYEDWNNLINSRNYSTPCIEQAMQLYAAQFIKAGEAVIGPAMDILPDTYEEELDAWFELTKKLELK